MSYTNKTLEELNVLDDFLMNAIVTTPEIGEAFCRTVLSVLLQRKVGKVKVISQRMIPPFTPEHRGIRMDVEIQELEAESGVKLPVSIYDLEPNLRRGVHLPRHNRFYQAKIDGRHLKSGEEDFVKLPNLYVITITNYDPFGYDYMMYHIRNQCVEVADLCYDDGLEFVYFYTGGHKGGDESIKAMLNYFQNSRKENAVDRATEEISEIVEQVRTLPEVRNEYMTLGDIIDWERKEAAEEAAEEENARQLVFYIENAMGNLDSDLESVCKILGVTKEDYEKAKELLKTMEESGKTNNPGDQNK
ncbi:MAG: hypothetical protein J6K58_10915 [Lachnospiraceae bacterium]|nr:hypothetical protein [Lachnospiraceae bacterium]